MNLDTVDLPEPEDEPRPAEQDQPSQPEETPESNMRGAATTVEETPLDTRPYDDEA